jgi:hypothetical protein
MKNLNDILSELQAIDQTSLENAVGAINQAITDLQAFIAAQPAPMSDPVASVVTTVTTVGGVATPVTVFPPQA